MGIQKIQISYTRLDETREENRHGLKGHRYLTENQDLMLWVQSLGMLGIFQPRIAKNKQGALSQGSSNLQSP